jgi:uncharacterized membrane protein YraQ (UPF0718 family)
MLGILIADFAPIAMPHAFRLYLTRHGVMGSLAGALCAVPQPFCSCCAATMAPSFVRLGATTHFVLAFVVGAPMLNVTTIVLALAMLPTQFAVLRIGAGVVVTVLVSLGRSADDRHGRRAHIDTVPLAPLAATSGRRLHAGVRDGWRQR